MPANGLFLSNTLCARSQCSAAIGVGWSSGNVATFAARRLRVRTVAAPSRPAIRIPLGWKSKRLCRVVRVTLTAILWRARLATGSPERRQVRESAPRGPAGPSISAMHPKKTWSVRLRGAIVLGVAAERVFAVDRRRLRQGAEVGDRAIDRSGRDALPRLKQPSSTSLKQSGLALSGRRLRAIAKRCPRGVSSRSRGRAKLPALWRRVGRTRPLHCGSFLTATGSGLARPESSHSACKRQPNRLTTESPTARLGECGIHVSLMCRPTVDDWVTSGRHTGQDRAQYRCRRSQATRLAYAL